VLDIGFGPGHQVFEWSSIVGAAGRVDEVDPADGAIAIGRRRCSELSNASFLSGDASDLPFGDETFDAAMSSQVFEYVDDVPAGIVVQLETALDPGSVSAILMKFVVGYVISQGVSPAEANAWAADLHELGAEGRYSFSLNEYIFTADKPGPMNGRAPR